MAEKLLKKKPRKVAPKKAPVEEAGRAGRPLPAAVLVGTYKGRQLAWIKRHGVYNYPVKDGDEFDAKAFTAIRELWLYADTKGTRHAFEAEFVGKMTKAEFLAANPTYAKLGPSKNKEYYVFKTKFLDYGPRLENPIVIVRTADFGGRSQKVKKAIEQFKADGEFAPLEHYLPADLAQVPRSKLRVCEAAVQLDFFAFLNAESLSRQVETARKIMARAREDHAMTCVEICAGAGGQAIGLERAGFVHVALIEYEREYCDVLLNNKPNWNVICADVRKFDGHPYRGVDLLAGGVPCPPFSVASKQLGENDERDLFPEAIRLIAEIRPRAVMLENVRGLLDPKFDTYRNSILNRIRDLGYVVQIRLLQASDYGVPQIRPRVVIVGMRNDEPGVFSYPPPNKRKAPSVGEVLHDLMGAKGWHGLEEWARHANQVAPTIVGGSKKHGGPDLGPTRARRAWANLGVDGLGIANEAPSAEFVGTPKLTKEMIAIIQGFPANWNFGKKKTSACRMIGNAFPPPVASAVGRRIRKALENEQENT